ncbi:hypothetical protein LINPERHAP2_LOCUS3258, partial [Linum perenne]
EDRRWCGCDGRRRDVAASASTWNGGSGATVDDTRRSTAAASMGKVSGFVFLLGVFCVQFCFWNRR